MSAEVTIVTAQADDALAIPAIALSGTSGEYTVRVLASDGTVETRSVEVGLIASDLAEVTTGLANGEAVVTGTSADQVTSSTSTASTGADLLSGGGGMPAGGPPAQPGS
jgi:macrolide-specific efflux system membrane fusion protein